MSPGATSSAGISPYCPSRQTNAVGSASLRSAAMAFSARYSLKTSTSHRQYSSLGIGVNPEFRAHARHDAVAHGIESSAFGPSTVNRSPGTGRGRNRGRIESIAGGREPRNELLLKHQELVILPKLITLIRDSSNGTEYSLCNEGAANGDGRGQNLFLDLRREAQHSHDLCYAGAGNAFPNGDVSLAGDLAGLQEGLPLDGLAEEFDHPGRPGHLRWFRSASVERGGPYHPVRRQPTRQSANVAVFEGPLGPEGDLDRLFAIGGHRGATVAILGEMDNPEVDLRLDPPGAGSNTVTLGDPCRTRTSSNLSTGNICSRVVKKMIWGSRPMCPICVQNLRKPP